MSIKEEVIIGNCRLLRGDCLEIMPKLYVDHVLCDPPYEASLHASKNSLRGPARVDTGPALRGLDFAPIDEIRGQVVDMVSTQINGWFLAFCTIEGVAKWADVINLSTLKYKRACIWVKPDSTPQLNGQGPAQGAECFVTAWGGTGHAKWNAGGKRGVYTHCVNGKWRHGEHPAEKPPNLMSELLLDFTNQGETILDPFMGSGTTGVACVNLNRKFIGIELDQKYFDIACKRIEDAVSRPRFDLPEPVKAKQEVFDLTANRETTQ